MPDETQAAKIINTLLALPPSRTPMAGSDRPADDLAHDFSTLRLPIYLKPLQKHIGENKPEIAAGIASIESVEATRLLIDMLASASTAVAQQIAWPLRQRIPEPADALTLFPDYRPQQDRSPRAAALIKASWSPDLAPPLRAYCVNILKKYPDAPPQTSDDLETAGYFLQMIGTKDDAPAVYAALDKVLTRNVHLADGQVLMDPQNAQQLLQTAAALIARGAPPPTPPAGVAATALELQHITAIKTYRPDHWHERLTALLQSDQPFLRYKSLQTLYTIPEPLPDAAEPIIEPLLSDTDPIVRLAAIQILGKAQSPPLQDRLMAMLRTSRDHTVLQYASIAAHTAHLDAQWLDICAHRLAETPNWYIFSSPLINLLEESTGNSRGGPPTARDAARARDLWITFLAQHQEQIAAGKKIPISEADPAMIPPPNKIYLQDGTAWPAEK
jgi:hypothetical protein